MNLLKVTFSVYPTYYKELVDLPWYLPLSEWESHGVRFLDFRKGLSRHEVRFVKRNRFSFAIKETTERAAIAEVNNYHKILSLGIHTLLPVGYVVTEKPPIEVKTPMGYVYESDNLVHVITVLEERAIPDSMLYRWRFKEENKRLIWDAVAELFAILHKNNIYWGDASLANLLVRFFKIRDESGRTRTELKAMLADAETVEFLPAMSDSMVDEELDFFFESMEWIHEDLRISGVVSEESSPENEKHYIKNKYYAFCEFLKLSDEFEQETNLSVRKYFISVKDAESLSSIYTQIKEHKWYLSERAGKEIPMPEAAKDWVETIFKPILAEFDKLRVFDYFAFKSAGSLFVEIMTHKYYLSQQKGEDVGIDVAILSYSGLYKNTAEKPLLQKLAEIFYKLLPKK